MATNYIQEGNMLTVSAPANVASGAGVLVGTIFGIASTDALSGEDVVIALNGVYEMPKVSAQAWTVGAAIYWDNTAKLTTTVATGNTLIGKATAVAANPSATGLVRLDG